eukprot:CAMPEP_0177647454 /NCGR_PEP_ID=MMETSP0447-20121125/10307_1 /TAXON_ID=0 /ORGANISM="Stygamoeba regulata, Strain BSH-02190019" /LENGTH=69 /DNA_ID=CAMNT_0019150037 /DNA_START=222 /DNA_END=431 /DNA_ORIENTATION=+
MSEAQLKRILAENERIKEDLEFSTSIMKVSDACKDLKEYCEKVKDPLFPDSGADNPFTDRAGGGGCSVL